MLMGAGLLSKFVELVAGKLIGKRLDLALDEKRRACYSFIELYSILQGFASITKGFVAQLEELRAMDDDQSDGQERADDQGPDHQIF
jgi:hypothetical protein